MTVTGLVTKTQPKHQYNYELQAKPLNELVAWLSPLYPDDDEPDIVAPMPKRADAQVRSAVDSFVNELSELIRQAALEAVTGAVGGRATTLRRHPPRAHRTGTARPAPGKHGQKRSPEELERTTTGLLAHIKKNPGQRIEEIAVALGVDSKGLALPAKRLIAAKAIKTKGQKRATRYFAR